MLTDKQLRDYLNSLTRDQRDRLLADALADQRRETERAARLEIAAKNQTDYPTFKRQFWPGYEETDFQQAIDTVLMGVAEYIFTAGQRGIGKAMIHMPPQHGKSTNVSQLFPAWLLSRMPDLPMMIISYGSDLAERNSRHVRSVLQSQAYQRQYPHVKLVGTRLGEWYTSENGGLIAAGIRGQITGAGARLIVIDDPIKNRQEAQSPTIRRNIQQAYSDDVLTRLRMPGGAILIMQTRWHTDDLSGWLLSLPDAEDWHVLSLPALAGEDDPLGREPGAALWPSRYPTKVLDSRRDKMGTYSFSALYQQEPLAQDAALFDTALIEIVDAVPGPLKQVVRFYDMAVSAKATADFTAGCKLGLDDNETLFVLDMYRQQATPALTGDNIILNALRDGPGVKLRLEADNAARVQLDYLLKDPRLRGFIVDAVAPKGDKYTRAAPLESRVNNRKLKLVRGPWNEAFLDELSVFPAGRHDDQVDALSGAYAMLSRETVTVYSYRYF